MRVIYRLNSDFVDGLADLFEARASIMRDAAGQTDGRPADAARVVWEDAVTMFWLNHEYLSKFDRREWRLDLGKMDTLAIIIDNPGIDVRAGSIKVDWRLDGWEEAVFEARQDVLARLVWEIELADIEFERKSDEPDARGYYRDIVEHVGDRTFAIAMHGMVVLKDGRYRLAAEAKAVTNSAVILQTMSTFVFAIMNGELKPVSREFTLPAV